MQNLKTIFGVIGALVPVLYCGGLLYYFLDVSGSMDEAATMGLGPTLLGLGAIGLLFSIPLLIKVVGMFVGPRSLGSGRRAGPDATTPDSKDAFDADAVLARYMANRSAETTAGSMAASPAHDGGTPATRPSFGRKISNPADTGNRTP